MSTQLVLLGTGTPNADPTRYQASLGVIVEEQAYIVDCGGGTLQRITQARDKYGHPALAMPNLTRLFFTHLHPDHSTGLPDFLIAPWVLDRDDPVQVFGPAGTQALVDGILAAYEPGIAEHRDGLAPINHPLTIQTTEITAGTIYTDDLVTVDAFPAAHGSMAAFSYKFTTPDKTIVISGDTAPTDALIEQATGCDILVHEVYSAVRFGRRSVAWQQYHSTVHTSSIELATIANKTKPGLLVLVHQLLWGATEAELLEEITSRYDGAVISGHDLMEIK